MALEVPLASQTRMCVEIYTAVRVSQDTSCAVAKVHKEASGINLPSKSFPFVLLGVLTNSCRRPDSYHTCYNLSGLSVVEHSHSYGAGDQEDPFASAFSWEDSEATVASEGDPARPFDTGADIKAIHPVYVIPHQAAHAMREWALSRPLSME